MSGRVVTFSPNGVRTMQVTDEEAAMLHHWRTLEVEGQLVITKRSGRLEHCEVKTFHSRSSFMGAVGVDKAPAKV